MKICRLCGSKLNLVYSLGNQPLANNLNLKSCKASKKFRLNLCECSKCQTLQHDINIDLNTLYSKYYYSSSVSKKVLENAKELFKLYSIKFKNIKNPKVLEIGCNDGYLLQFFKKKFDVLGIDPSKNMTKIAKSKNIKVINDFFTFKTANIIKKKYGKFDLIIANNVFAHNPNMISIMRSVRKLINDNGLVSIEVQDGEQLLKDGLFDMIYHEHFYYFEKNTFKNLLALTGFKIIKSEKINLHGKSLRILFQKSNIEEIRYFKRKSNLISNFKNRMDIHNKNVIEFFKKNKYSRIVIYGAAAKTTVFINYFRLDHNNIEYIVDDTPIKQNKYIPNTKIKIFSSDYIRNTKPNFIIISAWNYSYDIYSKIKYTEKWGCKILVFFPRLKYF